MCILSGQCVLRKQVSGSGSFAWDASVQGSGAYVRRLETGSPRSAGEAGGNVMARRMVLIR
ncbi:MAG: hypothetical protein A2268_16455 [Candidatus Raymondbacteria bacterium RifOxyA12_full_50_37]|uniref:Uncharacterized protein n=1 Tax=Candidatus Raymondbacteria bacterium RIFOXYD12_FULL_49_13 TaxID=1817890 RepID=A0A1F7F487_UNCRA|nr:MAG: hypothetical protein A2268_16455 [Candidatus Raymondbacteria bacterium RifOxyA12_full_50_37]OGJ86204.1 MAG: hypothetical protein A2248_16045 [Candidatus Raymondbacteria bacterium RIFOXYA2_FULL_49_16]OGJ95742.1 MAG: hypothetical protein A2453_11365 [Candidatus Raymondbacteria bacterium RIFOXYC2_FULL_50_21]OGJ98025.1 MAG: hypothetical protein A2487_20625 [Candidatus Raymondbacteria bacterium RifOxyC12_full_50_8]OGK00088.1 MAG: hypothetical protein A2350_15625 [Candidatus Raymondbacteria b